MSSKKSKKMNGGDIIKNMFGGMDIKDLEAKVWIIIILASCILLTVIVVYTKPYIDKLFKSTNQEPQESSQDSLVDALKTLLDNLKGTKDSTNLKKNLCNKLGCFEL